MAKLLDAGMAVLGEKGFHAARVDDIVRAARTSHGTFYLYFANKEDLLRALAEECAAEMTALAGELHAVESGPDGAAELRAWLARFAETYGRYGAVIRAWMEDQVTDRDLRRLGAKAFQDIAAAFVTRIRDARPAHLGDEELAAAALLALIERLNYYVYSRQVPFDDEDVLDTLAAIVHRGFLATSA